jgi:hypothetical protein
MSNSNPWPLINRLDREQKKEILENHGYAAYDHEDEASWDNTLVVDIENGDIDISELEDALDAKRRPGF